VDQPRLELLDVGSLGPSPLPPRAGVGAAGPWAAALYVKHALVLNVPLNHNLNHRFFELMAAVFPRWCSAIPAWWASTATWPSG